MANRDDDKEMRDNVSEFLAKVCNQRHHVAPRYTHQDQANSDVQALVAAFGSPDRAVEFFVEVVGQGEEFPCLPLQTHS